jgi:uncharacterized surface protein with fasciclin (FAS1) repeats
MKNITDVVSEGKNYTNLNKGVVAADLKLELSGTGPYTIFAPTDIAFGKLEEGEFTKLQKPEHKAELAELLHNHVIKGKTYYRDLKDGQKLKTVNGKELLVSVKDGAVAINGAKLENHETEGANGVVHSIESILKFS